MEIRVDEFCWHHGTESRLKGYLKENIVDCPTERFLTDHNLNPGDNIRFSVKIRNEPKGKIIARAELDSSTPFPLATPKRKKYPYGVKLRNVKFLDSLEYCIEYKTPNNISRSHWSNCPTEQH